MKILLVGMGSIGRRHLACLHSIEGLKLAALRTAKGTLREECGVEEFFSMHDALAFEPDGVIISNPTSLHVETALPFLKQGSKVLIEKPVAENSIKAAELKPYEDQIRVAYCMRFLPLFNYLKGLFKIEQPFKITFKRSFYLPKWHPYADYRTEYTARKDLGGGVIRTLSHEIDLAINWMGKPESVIGVVDKISHLELDTDDFAFFTLKAPNGARINFELDFFSPVNINEGEAFTEKGKYFWNVNELTFADYSDAKAEPVEIEFSEAFSKMYTEQVLDFVEFINTGRSKNARLNEAVAVIEVIEAIDGLTE